MFVCLVCFCFVFVFCLFVFCCCCCFTFFFFFYQSGMLVCLFVLGMVCYKVINNVFSFSLSRLSICLEDISTRQANGNYQQLTCLSSTPLPFPVHWHYYHCYQFSLAFDTLLLIKICLKVILEICIKPLYSLGHC